VRRSAISTSNSPRYPRSDSTRPVHAAKPAGASMGAMERSVTGSEEASKAAARAARSPASEAITSTLPCDV
jgi:hypothetical protein